MDNTSLKAQIDSQITNKTAAGSITPTVVGDNLKDIVDYTDQEVNLNKVVDATSNVKGKIKLSGDLGGTADAPTVPNLTIKENKSNKSTSVATDGGSDEKYPSVKAVKTYADGLVVGLVDDRGGYNASVNTFPASGGSGTAGAIMKGDLWFISTAGTLGGVSVAVGASVRALVDTPAQDAAKWNILNTGLGYVSENQANKASTITTETTDTKYPSVKAVKTYVDANSGSIALTTGNITGVSGNTAILIYGINNVTQTSSDTDKVILPETGIKVGQSIYIFCEDNIRIRGNVAGTAVINTNVYNFVSFIDAVLGDSFRFTKSSSEGSWVFEKLENNLKSQQVEAVDGFDLPEIKNIDYIRCFTSGPDGAIKLTGPHNVGREYYIKNPTSYEITLVGYVENINGFSNFIIPPNSYWHLIKEDNGTNSITAFSLSINKNELTSNKSTNVDLGTSDTLYPTQNAVKTYVDANAGGGVQVTKSVKVSLSSSQILNLFTTPIEVVPAVPGKVLIIRQVFQKYTHVSNAYTIGGNFRIGLGEPDFAFVSFFPMIQNSDNAEAFNAVATSSSTSGQTYINLPLILGCLTSSPTGGDGTLDLHIVYFEITI